MNLTIHHKSFTTYYEYCEKFVESPPEFQEKFVRKILEKIANWDSDDLSINRLKSPEFLALPDRLRVDSNGIPDWIPRKLN